MTLRVALVSTPFVSVPPRGYGGTELVVAELAKALTAQGIEVVVYATGDSELLGIEVRSYFPAAQWPLTGTSSGCTPPGRSGMPRETRAGST